MSTIEDALIKAEKQKKESDPSVQDVQHIEEKSSVAINDSESINTASDRLEPVVENDEQPVQFFDWDKLKKLGFICRKDTHSKIAEEYRSIKRPLVINALGTRKDEIERSNLILVTSSVPSEGKTFTSINLAFSIAAELDKRVLLIDADVAKPSVHDVLGITQEPGLIDFLEGEVQSLSQIMLRTEIEGLRVIPAGGRHKFSTELLASNKMIELARELSERYHDRIVIFDTPPLLATTQAEVLAGLVGQVILVVAAEETPQNIVMESVKKLESCSDVVLTLLNKTRRTLDTSYYGYGKY